MLFLNHHHLDISELRRAAELDAIKKAERESTFFHPQTHTHIYIYIYIYVHVYMYTWMHSYNIRKCVGFPSITVSPDWGNVQKSSMQEEVDVLTPLVDENAVTKALKVHLWCMHTFLCAFWVHVGLLFAWRVSLKFFTIFSSDKHVFFKWIDERSLHSSCAFSLLVCSKLMIPMMNCCG